MRAATLICGAVAVVACAWFALGARQALDTQRASALANQGNSLSSAQVAKIRSLVHADRLLNPDQEPEVLLGQAEVEGGQFGRARQSLEPVTRSEPQNLVAWAWLAHASGSDPALLYLALRHIRALDPLVPRAQ